MPEIKEIAKIDRTFLGYEDHGIFTCYLYVDYGHSGQAICGYDLRGEFGSKFIQSILNACGVNTWENLPGRTIHVIKEDEWNGTVHGIAPLPTEPGEEFRFADWSRNFEE